MSLPNFDHFRSPTGTRTSTGVETTTLGERPAPQVERGVEEWSLVVTIADSRAIARILAHLGLPPEPPAPLPPRHPSSLPADAH